MGNGTFLSEIAYSTSANPHYIEIVDVNSDGRRDIITTNYGSYCFSVLLYAQSVVYFLISIKQITVFLFRLKLI